MYLISLANLLDYQDFSQKESNQGLKLTTHPHLVPGLRMCGTIPLIHLCVYDVNQENFIFYFKV